MIRPEDVIKNNSREEIQRLSSIVKSKGFQSAEDSESPFDTYEAQLLSEWLVGTCKRVFAKTFRKRARVVDSECRVVITNDTSSPPREAKLEQSKKEITRKLEPSSEYVYKPPKKWSRRRRQFKKRNDETADKQSPEQFVQQPGQSLKDSNPRQSQLKKQIFQSRNSSTLNFQSHGGLGHARHFRSNGSASLRSETKNHKSSISQLPSITSKLLEKQKADTFRPRLNFLREGQLEKKDTAVSRESTGPEPMPLIKIENVEFDANNAAYGSLFDQLYEPIGKVQQRSIPMKKNVFKILNSNSNVMGFKPRQQDPHEKLDYALGKRFWETSERDENLDQRIKESIQIEISQGSKPMMLKKSLSKQAQMLRDHESIAQNNIYNIPYNINTLVTSSINKKSIQILEKTKTSNMMKAKVYSISQKNQKMMENSRNLEDVKQREFRKRQ